MLEQKRELKSQKRTFPDDASTFSSFDRTLLEALETLTDREIPYALIGGVAVSGLGRPRSTHDIDIFIRPEDANPTLKALADCGFETEETDPSWLYKGFKEDVMVDIIFRSEGGIYFDDEMLSRTIDVNYHDHEVRCVSPEDLVIIKSAVHSEQGSRHWHDALAVLAHSVDDWEYLLRRARRAPRRLLALLIYAQSNDIWVPNQLIHKLYRFVFENERFEHSRNFTFPAGRLESEAKAKSIQRTPARSEAPRAKSTYLSAKLEAALAQDERTGTLDVDISLDHEWVRAQGVVFTQSQRQAVEDIVKELVPDRSFQNDIQLLDDSLPGESEVLQ